MSTQELVKENIVTTERNGVSTEESATDSAVPEPPKLTEKSPLEQEKEIATVDAVPEHCPDGDVPLDTNEDDHESVPDDLNDFVVLDEAEITESEGEDQANDDDEDEEAMQWDCPLERLAPRTYTDKDLVPTELDPRCKPNWPLAAYWPVYVGNFRLYRKFDSDNNCSHAVQKYFASKGLPAFMVYRLKDSFFEEYQKRVGFYDMLVYFCNKKDAIRAVKWCHRDLYYGHRLNVYCGRTPAIFPKFPNKKFIVYRFQHKKAEDKLETETNLEKYLSTFGKILCISKQDINTVLVQFSRSPRLERAPHNDRVKAYANKGVVSKQRFVESNIEQRLSQEIAENPKFMRMRLIYKLLVSIKHGVIPEMFRPWEKAEIEESLIEMRRRANWRHKNPYNLNVRDSYKPRHDDFDNGSSSKSRRQLIREAKSLEIQLMRIKTQIHDGKPAPPKLPALPRLPVQKKVIPKDAQTNDSELQPKPKRQKTETQLIRQRIRGSRRYRNRPRNFARSLDIEEQNE